MIEATRKRLSKFNGLRKQQSTSLFWDIVVLTAADELQKSAYEKQLQVKLDNQLLPTSAEYIVVADPPKYKIGNGGSTLVVLQTLQDRYGVKFSSKRTIIVHAGGYSQRLPNASVLGKVFMSIPSNNSGFQMLEVKLASYIDFPQRMDEGGVFVCCADTFESYDDNDLEWKFPNTGFTGLAHPSSLSIGRTHGVYILQSSPKDTPLIRSCSKFLHKPSIPLMRRTKNCVHQVESKNGTEEIVLTDSCFFISPPACRRLLAFYLEHQPLTCEIDAYGDFLQSLGHEATPGYIDNHENVVQSVNGLSSIRRAIYDTLHGSPLHVLALAHLPGCPEQVSSRFFHFGTIEEYMMLFAEKSLAEMLSINPISSTDGSPFKYTTQDQHNAVNGVIKANNNHPLLLPYIMCSAVYSGVNVGESSVVEFSVLRECVSIGSKCIVSHCSFNQKTTVPSSTFIHTIPVRADELGLPFDVGFCTILFAIRDDMKKKSTTSQSGEKLFYFGRSLDRVFSDWEAAFSGASDDVVSLWNAKLFDVYETREASSDAACSFLNKLSSSHDFTRCQLVQGHIRLSMDDILRMKNIDELLHYRAQLLVRVDEILKEQSCLPSLYNRI